MYVQNMEYQRLGARERRVKVDLLLFTHHIGYDIVPVR